jgi:hypothetical protein
MNILVTNVASDFVMKINKFTKFYFKVNSQI